MTLERPPTSSLGGGRSARATAVVVALVLVGVVAIAVSGRPPPPVPAPSPLPAAAVEPSPTTATPPATTPVPSPLSAAPSATPLDAWPPTCPWSPEQRPRSGNFRYMAVVVAVGRMRQMLPLTEDKGGTLRAIVRHDFPRPATSGVLEIVEMATLNDRTNWTPIAAFRLPLDPLVPETRRSGMVVEREIEPHPEQVAAPLLVRVGYSVNVLAESRMDSFALRITIEPGGGDVEGRARRPMSVLGDDGLIGDPGASD